MKKILLTAIMLASGLHAHAACVTNTTTKTTDGIGKVGVQGVNGSVKDAKNQEKSSSTSSKCITNGNSKTGGGGVSDALAAGGVLADNLGKGKVGKLLMGASGVAALTGATDADTANIGMIRLTGAAKGLSASEIESGSIDYRSKKIQEALAAEQQAALGKNDKVTEIINNSQGSITEAQMREAASKIQFPRSKSSWESTVQAASSKYGVCPALIHAVILTESNYNATARSGVGAGGMMQLMPATAKGLGVTNVYNPVENINGGTKYLAQLLKRYNGNIILAAAAYNAGMGNVDKAKGVPNFPETQNYVKKVRAGVVAGGGCSNLKLS